MPSCEHRSFRATVEVSRLVEEEDADAHAWAADVRVACEDCGAPFGFKGMEAGLSFDAPMRSIDALEARLPLMSPMELDLHGPFPPGASRMPESVVEALEELSRMMPVTRLRCDHPIRDGHREGAGLFRLRDVAKGGLSSHVIVEDPEGWRLYGRVRRHDAAGTLLIEAKTAWRLS